MKPSRFVLLIGVSTLFASAQASATVQVKVSPDGSITTLFEARDQVRELRAEGETGDINVVIEDGTYVLDQTLVFGLEDSAPAGASTRYVAAEGANPLISGGITVTYWEQTDLENGRIWKAPVPWAKGDAFFHALYDGDQRLPRARSGSFQVSQGSEKIRYLGPLENRIQFNFEGDILKGWENLEDIELYGQPSVKWAVSYLPVETVDPANGEASLAVPATYTMQGTFYVENALDYLDQPGEWVLNSKEGALYYWPESGEPGDQIVAPRLNELIRVAGENDPLLEGAGDKPVRGIEFEGLTFSYADRQKFLPDDIGIQHDWNLWDKANGLVRFRGAEDCAVRNCVFKTSASDGVRLDLYVQNVTVEDSTFRDLGGTGVILSGYGPGLKDVNKGNVIHNNELERVGQIFLHAPGIFVWQSGNNRISHNHIHDTAYSGLIVAGVRRRCFGPKFEEMGITNNPFSRRWQFPEGTREHMPTIRWDEITLGDDIQDWANYEPYMHASGNVIEFNEIHDTLKELHDGNCIYLSAHGKDNIVRYNVTYNHLKGAMIRTDDDSHGVTIDGNITFGTQSPRGFDTKGVNTWTNNLLVNSIIRFARVGNNTHPDSVMQRNVVYHTRPLQGKEGFHWGMLETMKEGLDYNLYWSTGYDAQTALEAQQEGSETEMIDRNSTASDPRFTDISVGDFSFEAGSPAEALQIQPLSLELVSKIGNLNDPFINRLSPALFK